MASSLLQRCTSLCFAHDALSGSLLPHLLPSTFSLWSTPVPIGKLGIYGDLTLSWPLSR